MKKKRVWPAPLIILISGFVLASLVFAGSIELSGKQMNKEHVVSGKFANADNSGRFYDEGTFQLEDGRYIAVVSNEYSEIVAFVSDEDNFDIGYSTDDLDAVSYYNDDYEIMDISQEYLEYMEYTRLDSNAPVVVRDISDVQSAGSYSSEAIKYEVVRGSSIMGHYEAMKRIKVYDYSSAYLGFEDSFSINSNIIGGVLVEVLAYFFAIAIAYVTLIAAFVVLSIKLEPKVQTTCS